MDTLLPVIHRIETPYHNYPLKNIIPIKGWALSPFGIDKIVIEFDGKKYISKEKQNREDVFKIYPEYKEKNSGFYLEIYSSNFIGKKNLNIKIHDNEGFIINQDIVIERIKNSVIYDVENIVNNYTIAKNENIQGYVLSNKLDYIKAKIDDIEVPISMNIDRTDISIKFPEYNNDNCGWEINSNNITKTKGIHNLEILVKEKGENLLSNKYKLNVPSYDIIYEIESPGDNNFVKDEVLVRGYYLSEAGLQKVTGTINGINLVDGETHIYRNDVYSENPEYGEEYSGFEITIDTKQLSFGIHTLNISMYDYSGKVTKKNINVQKSETQWKDSIFQGDIPSKNILLHEIKSNLINVINDYIGLGIENEDELIKEVQKLWTGQIIPDRNDWNIIVDVLKELAIIKERGQEYTRFISDLDDGLGVSDLYKIKDFINYIQKLGPVESNMKARMTSSEMYQMNYINYDSPDNFKKSIILNWDNGEPGESKAFIEFEPNPVEDVKNYYFEIQSGNFYQNITQPANNPHPFNIDLLWSKWFNENNISTAFLKITHYVLDKRGNSNFREEIILKNPPGNEIPIGVKEYVIEYSMNKSPWIEIGRTKEKTFTHYIPEISGDSKYRVKAIDKNTKLETDFIETDFITLDFLPPAPGIPNPKANPDYNWIDVSWATVAHAESYDIYIGNSIVEAKKKNGWYFNTKNLKQRITNLAENTKYKITVVAINRRTTAQKSIESTTKKRIPKTITFGNSGVKVWRESYQRDTPWGKEPWQGPAWRTETNDIMQAEWRETWPDGWQPRSGGAYMAYRLQNWGINRTCVIFNYNDIINKLKNKKITAVEFSMKRHNTIHGWGTATPIHPCNHNETNMSKAGGRPGMFNLRVCNKSVDRGGWIRISDGNTKFLLEQVVNGKAKGIGFYKEYPGRSPEGDKAYIRFNPKMEIKVTYFDN